MAITTKTYKISHSHYSSAVIKQWLQQWWMVIAFPIIAQILLAVYNDIIFLYTGFMTMFVIFPIIYMFVFYYYALAPESRYSTLPKHLEINENEIAIIYEPIDENSPAPKPETISPARITDIKHLNQQLFLVLDNNQYKFIILPFTALENTSDITQIESMLMKRQQNAL